MGEAGKSSEDDKRDVVMIARVDSTRNEIHVIKPVADGIEKAVLRPVEEGVPLMGDLVRLHPNPDFPMLAEIETVMRHPDGKSRARRSSDGPPMVASEAYRRGWDAIFGVRPAQKDDVGAN